MTLINEYQLDERQDFSLKRLIYGGTDAFRMDKTNASKTVRWTVSEYAFTHNRAITKLYDTELKRMTLEVGQHKYTAELFIDDASVREDLKRKRREADAKKELESSGKILVWVLNEEAKSIIALIPKEEFDANKMCRVDELPKDAKLGTYGKDPKKHIYRDEEKHIKVIEEEDFAKDFDLYEEELEIDSGNTGGYGYDRRIHELRMKSQGIRTASTQNTNQQQIYYYGASKTRTGTEGNTTYDPKDNQPSAEPVNTPFSSSYASYSETQSTNRKNISSTTPTSYNKDQTQTSSQKQKASQTQIIASISQKQRDDKGDLTGKSDTESKDETTAYDTDCNKEAARRAKQAKERLKKIHKNRNKSIRNEILDEESTKRSKTNIKQKTARDQRTVSERMNAAEAANKIDAEAIQKEKASEKDPKKFPGSESYWLQLDEEAELREKRKKQQQQQQQQQQQYTQQQVNQNKSKPEKKATIEATTRGPKSDIEYRKKSKKYAKKGGRKSKYPSTGSHGTEDIDLSLEKIERDLMQIPDYSQNTKRKTRGAPPKLPQREYEYSDEDDDQDR